MKNIIILIFISNISLASVTLLEQGDIKVTNDDMNAFGFTIPKDKRKGFFKSKKRLSDTILNILKLKQIASYGINVIPKDEIEENYQNAIPSLGVSKNLSILGESKLIQIKKLLKLKVISSLVKKHIKDEIDSSEDFTEFAKETYMVNQDKYKYSDEIDYKYVTILYDTNNKENQTKYAKELLNKLQNNEISFELLISSYEEENNIEMAGVIKSNQFIVGNEFHNKLFNSKKGLIPELIYDNSRIFLIEVLKIEEGKYLTFEEVKDNIISKIKSKQIESRYHDIYSKIVKGYDLKVNEKAISEYKFIE